MERAALHPARQGHNSATRSTQVHSSAAESISELILLERKTGQDTKKKPHNETSLFFVQVPHGARALHLAR
jgi:hypothetical protein